MADVPARPDAEAVRRIAGAWGFSGAAAVRRLHSGHINESFHLREDDRQALLQWLNPVAFPDPFAVQRNVEVLAAHLTAAAGPRVWPRLLTTADGSGHVRAGQDCWRAWAWFDGAVTMERPDSAAAARAGAAAFADLLVALDDLDPARIEPVLPGFHDPGRRLAELDAALAAAEPSRIDAARGLLDEVSAWRDAEDADADGGRLRLIHGDAKFGNLLFLDPGGAVTVVDFDTLMPGTLATDFGDLVRSACASGDEDDPRSRVDDALLQALCVGFRDALAGLPTPADIEAMARAPGRIARVLAIRFLADHLSGDRYFRIHRPGQNLDRARAQWRLGDALAQRGGRIRALLAERTPGAGPG